MGKRNRERREAKKRQKDSRRTRSRVGVRLIGNPLALRGPRVEGGRTYARSSLPTVERSVLARPPNCFPGWSLRCYTKLR